MTSNERRCMPSGASMCELVRSWRLPEFVCVVIVWKIGMMAVSFAPMYDQYIPPNNADGVNGYPVRLDSVWCLAEDISSCSTSSDTDCCLMMEDGVQPGETVTSPMLKFVFFGVPLVFIVLRQISIRCGVFRSPRSFADLLLGLLFCQMMCLLLTDTIKAYVARPRPNCFALQALVEYGGSDVYPFQETSIKSFPSGHSSESMAGSSFITLVCWADLLHCSACFTGWKRSLLAYLAVLPALISIWVGVTRIRDYWHFQDDVLTGWTIGAISAAVAVRWVIYPETYWRRSTMENKNLEEHMEINMLPDGQNNAFTLIDPTYGSAGYSPHDQKQNPIASV